MAFHVLLSPPDVGPAEEQAVCDAVRSGWVAPAGPHLDAFERELARRCGTAAAVGMTSGTAALHLALLGIGVGPGDVVIVPTLTFAATANAVMYTGAEPCFVDVEPTTGNVDPELLVQAVDEQRRAGRRVAGFVPVDLFGRCADYTRLVPAAISLQVPMVEDAAEALGASHAGRPAGSFGIASALSFNGNKIITTSGGGALLTDEHAFAERARYLSTQAREPSLHYEHTEVGYNYRLSNVLAALGTAQLSRLDQMIARRREIRGSYRSLFASTEGVRLLDGGDDSDDNCWLSVVIVDPDRAGWDAHDLGARLARRGIESRPVWKPMHQQPAFKGCATVLSGVADRLFEHGLALPSGSKHDVVVMGEVADVINEFLEEQV
jgi:dTDP-4-amino-4,6-dideoxygalactose transaminase